MSDDEGRAPGGAGGDDDVSLPKATVNKLIQGQLAAFSSVQTLPLSVLTPTIPRRTSPIRLYRVERGQRLDCRLLQGCAAFLSMWKQL
jgi:hypothetical protein